MRFQALATDYDGTIARHGKVSEGALQSLRELLATGRRLILVTGRELPELLQILPILVHSINLWLLFQFFFYNYL